MAIRAPSKSFTAISHFQITIVFESPISSEGVIAKDLAAHGDFVKDVAFVVQDLDELVKRAREGGAEILKEVTEEQDENGKVRYAVLRTVSDHFYSQATNKFIYKKSI